MSHLAAIWAASISFLGLFSACGGDAPASPSPGPDATVGSSSGAGAAAGTGATTTTTGSGGGGEGGAATTTGTGGVGGPAVGYPVPDWPTGSPDAYGLDQAKLDAAADVAAGLDSYCLLVIRHGVLVAEHYWGGTDKTTKNPSWSIAKSYTSALVGIALERGEIGSLDDSVSDYVPEWQGTDREAITIRNLLSMTSGLEWSVFQDYVAMAALATDDTAFAVALPSAEPPGSSWIYHNGGVQIFEAVMKAATGATLEEYAEQHLWSKLGMSAIWDKDPAGNPTAYANVRASCRDQARFGYLYLHGGAWNGEQVVPAGHVAATLTPSQSYNRAYGWLWWLNGESPALDPLLEAWPGRMVPFAPKDLFGARGLGNQFIDVIPSLDLIVVRFGVDPVNTFDLEKLTTDQKFETHDEILAPILDAVVGG